MATRFVNVPAEALNEALVKAGFTKNLSSRRKEVFFSRPIKGHLQLNVWTSVTEGEEDAAECGADAIRVAMVYAPPKTRPTGVLSATKILRTGTVEGVIARVLERARELWAIGAKMERGQHCPCGAPRYLDSGKCVDRSNPTAHAQKLAAATVARTEARR